MRFYSVFLHTIDGIIKLPCVAESPLMAIEKTIEELTLLDERESIEDISRIDVIEEYP